MQGYLGPQDLHCSSSDLEERFGKAKFGEQWVGRQTDDDLSLLTRVRDRGGDWQSFGVEDGRERRRPPDYVGPPGDRDVAGAIDRAHRRKRMLAQVRELLSLLERCADLLNPELSDLSEDELKKLAEAREIGLLMSGRRDAVEDSPTLRDVLEVAHAHHACGLAPVQPSDDLTGLMLGRAFMRHVIEDAKVQDLGAAVVKQELHHRFVFDEGRLPGRAEIYRWPVAASDGWLREQFGSGRIPDGFDYDPSGEVRNVSVFMNHRIKSFFDPLRSGEIVAVGVYCATGIEGTVNKAQWSRSETTLDVRTSDLFETIDGVTLRLWANLRLLVPASAAQVIKATIETSAVAQAKTNSVSPGSKPVAAPDPARVLASLPAVAQFGKKAGRGAGDVFNPIVRAMLADLANGNTTPEVLAEDTKIDLSKAYGGGSEVCNKARAAVWVVRAMLADVASATLTVDVLKKMEDRYLEERYIGFLNNKKFGTSWDIFGKARLIVLEDHQQATNVNSRQRSTIGE